MLYKVLSLAALLVQETHAGAGSVNKIDPRFMAIRYAVPPGGKTDDSNTKLNKYGQNIKKCGVDVSPNAIQKCYYTDCFEKLHKFGSRRRAAGSEIHAKIRDGKVLKGQKLADQAGTIADKDYDSCGKIGGRRRRMAAADPLAIQCRANTCKEQPDVNQFRYWVSGAKAYEGLGVGVEANNKGRGKCPKGNAAWGVTAEGQKDYDAIKTPGTDAPNLNYVKPAESWIWYSTNQGYSKKAGGADEQNCIYGKPPSTCQCKTLVCRVSTDKETSLDTSKWSPVNAATGTGANKKWTGTNTLPAKAQSSDECNFIIRIEDFWHSPAVSKKMMWWIFIIAATVALILTAYYRYTYGGELEKSGSEKSGDEGSKGSGGN